MTPVLGADVYDWICIQTEKRVREHWKCKHESRRAGDTGSERSDRHYATVTDM